MPNLKSNLKFIELNHPRLFCLLEQKATFVVENPDFATNDDLKDYNDCIEYYCIHILNNPQLKSYLEI